MSWHIFWFLGQLMYEQESKGMDWFEVYQKEVCIAVWDFDINQKCNWGILEISEVVFFLGFDQETFQQTESIYLWVWWHHGEYQSLRIWFWFEKVWFWEQRQQDHWAWLYWGKLEGVFCVVLKTPKKWVHHWCRQ